MQLTTSTKVLPSIDGLPSFETTTMGAGTLVGAEVQGMATYTSDMRADGTLYGECPNSGVVMAQDGVATFTATGIGRFTADGGSSFMGMVESRQGWKISCIEEIAFRMGYIKSSDLKLLSKSYNNEYGEYLLKVSKVEL